MRMDLGRLPTCTRLEASYYFPSRLVLCMMDWKTIFLKMIFLSISARLNDKNNSELLIVVVRIHSNRVSRDIFSYHEHYTLDCTGLDWGGPKIPV